VSHFHPGDSSALACVKARKWRATFVRADVVVRQTRLLVYSQYLGTGGSHERARESETQEGQSDLADRET
jgi:hypothetical protein